MIEQLKKYSKQSYKPKSAWKVPFPLAGKTNNTPVLAYLASIVIFGILTLPSKGKLGRNLKNKVRLYYGLYKKCFIILYLD